MWVAYPSEGLTFKSWFLLTCLPVLLWDFVILVFPYICCIFVYLIKFSSCLVLLFCLLSYYLLTCLFSE